MNRVLTTGTSGGLGGFLVKKYKDSVGITRENPLNKNHYNTHYDLIIHCAFNQNRDNLDLVDKKCYEDNIVLTQNLLKISHDRFVFISTCQTPPDNMNTYVVMKRICEHMVREESTDCLILRPSTLVGENMRNNTLCKIINDEDITLTEDSVNDFILFDDVYNAIQFYNSGTFYLLSQKSITMGEIANEFGRDINFGHYKYDISNIQSDIDIGKTSLEVIMEYFK